MVQSLGPGSLNLLPDIAFRKVEVGLVFRLWTSRIPWLERIKDQIVSCEQ